jgi:hypothetical protein
MVENNTDHIGFAAKLTLSLTIHLNYQKDKRVFKIALNALVTK